MERKGIALFLVFCLILGLASPMTIRAAGNQTPKLNKKNITLSVGEKTKLKVKNASGTIKWSSSNQKVASVSKGTVKAKKAGTTNITAKTGKKKLVCKVNVKAKPELNFHSAGLEKNESFTLKLTGKKGNIKWSSSNKKVAAVSKKGKVTAKGNGNATIKAKAGKKTYRCKITVAPRKLNQTTASLAIGKTLQLSLSNPFGSPNWISSNNQIASVNSSGLVTAQRIGTVQITAICNKKQYSCSLSVFDPNTEPAPNPEPTPVPNPDASIQITFTNPEIETLSSAGDETPYQSIYGYEESFTITGQVDCHQTTLKTLSYVLKDSANSQISNGNLTANNLFSLTIQPKTGTHTLTITAEGTDGITSEKNLTIVRYSKQITITDKAIALNEAETDEFANGIEEINYRDEEEIIHGNAIPRTYIDITMSSDSQFVKDLQSGKIKKDDVIFAAEERKLPTGFTGIVVNYETFGSKTNITFREADFSDLYGEEGCIEMSEILEEDPVAFTITPAQSPDLYTQRNVLRAEKDDYYDRSIFPEGLSVNLSPKVSIANGGISLGMDFNNIILYDKDKKKNTKDQLILKGSAGIQDLKADAKIEWNHLLPQQIRYNESYGTNLNLNISASYQNDLFDFSDLIKKANGEFKNECKVMGVKVSGIDMSDKLLIALVGIHLNTKIDVIGLGDMGEYAKKISSPLIFAALYMDISGNITGSFSLGFQSSTYVEQGFNLYNSAIGNVKYTGSFQPDKKINLGKGYVLESYSKKRKAKNDYAKPNPIVTLEGTAKIGIEMAVGAMAGIMCLGIIPADCYLEAYSSTQADFDGKVDLKLGVTDEELKRIQSSARIRATQETGARIGHDLKVAIHGLGKLLSGIQINVAHSDSDETKWVDIHLDYPQYRLYGTTSKFIELGTTEKELMGGVDFKLYRQKELDAVVNEYTEDFLLKYTPDITGKSNADGTYNITGIKREAYVMLVTQTGFEPYVETIDFNQDTEKIICLTPFREKNWLDVCQPWKYSGYAGITYIGDGKGSMNISGINYNVGFCLDGGDAGTGSSYAYLNLEKKFSKLKVRIGHVDNSSLLTTILKVYLDGEDEPSQTIPLSPNDVSKEYELLLNYASTAIFKMERLGISNWAHAKYGFVEGVWYTENEALGTAQIKNPFENADWNADFMDLCPPFLVHAGDKRVIADETKLNMGGIDYNSGFVLNTNDGGYAVFNTNGEFSALKIKVGLMTNSSRTYNTKIKVFLDGEDKPSTTIEQKASMIQDLTIPINHANGVRIEVDRQMDSGTGAGATYGFVNGKWIR